MARFFARLCAFLLFLLLIVVVASFSTVWMQSYRELKTYKLRESEAIARQEALQVDAAYKEEYLRKLMTDPAFLERVVRERIGYVEPDDVVYLFEEPR